MKIRKWQVVILFLVGLLALQYLAYSPMSQSRNSQSPFEYVVQQSDTCSKIARNFGVSIMSIVMLNNLKPNCSDMSPGQTLHIPYPTLTVISPGFVFVSPTSHAIVDCDTVLYTVKEGDTLEGITQKYNVQVDPIKVFNGIVDEALALTPGNKLIIPLCFRNNRNAGFNLTTAPNPIVDVFPACHEIILTVLQGDTLDSISLNYAVSKDYIKQYNRIETDEVLPGMTLLIQVCSNMSTPTVTPTK